VLDLDRWSMSFSSPGQRRSPLSEGFSAWRASPPTRVPRTAGLPKPHLARRRTHQTWRSPSCARGGRRRVGLRGGWPRRASPVCSVGPSQPASKGTIPSSWTEAGACWDPLGLRLPAIVVHRNPMGPSEGGVVGSPQGHWGVQQARPGCSWDTRVRQVQSEEAKGDKATPPRMQATRGAVLLSSHSPPTHASSPPSEREREFLRLVANRSGQQRDRLGAFDWPQRCQGPLAQHPRHDRGRRAGGLDRGVAQDTAHLAGRAARPSRLMESSSPQSAIPPAEHLQSG